MATLEDSLRTMIKIFRRESHRVLACERTTVHGANDMLMVLQLAMAEVNKQERGEFEVALSDVLVAWKYLLLDKLHLPLNNAVRPENYELILEAYRAFLTRSSATDLVDLLSMYEQLRAELDPEEPVGPVELFGFLLGDVNVSDVTESLVPSTPSSTPRPHSSQVKMAARRVFCSYLTLLVNSKSDLSLARVLNAPSRALGRAAFTDLKRAARDSNTSLFLAVTSFVRAIQLGGKGYAPAESDPLRKHVKGLSDFVHFSDNLAEILGEIPDPSACGPRLVAAIRTVLVKGRTSADALYTACDQAANELNERLSQLHQKRECAANGTGISPARPKAYAINHATAYGGRETLKVLMALLDEEALSPPCRNKADLLSEDQSVFGTDEGTCLLTLFRSPEGHAGCSPEPLKNRVQRRQDSLKPKVRDRGVRSQFACTYREEEEEPPLNRVLEFPSSSQVSTCVHPAPKQGQRPAMNRVLELESASAARDSGTAGHASGSLGAQRGEAALGPRCVNAQGGGAPLAAGRKNAAANQTREKGGKRKRTDADPRCGGSENQPLQKKAPRAVSGKPPAQKPTKAPGKKLIAGQGKLTSFFRL